MDNTRLTAEGRKALDEILGYLNLSSGTPDTRFRSNLNDLYRELESAGYEVDSSWQTVGRLLRDRIEPLRREKAAFRDAEQAEAVVTLVFDHVIPAYREHHRDLLFHLPDAVLFRPFFLSRVCEAALSCGGPWNETQRIVSGALASINDYVGHRPVAVLRTDQKIEPYAHERVCPIPLYLRDVGVAVGRYSDLIETALSILQSTGEEMLEEAWFDPELMVELSLDPRAYDFDHPADRRPNYVFGEWDPDDLDQQGRFRRFIVRDVTLEGLLQRVNEVDSATRGERLFEAAAALAGTVLMAAAVRGRGPDTHDSSASLASLVRHIAQFRDEFYRHLLSKATGTHGQRLREEAQTRKQPFAEVRQTLNQFLARRRSAQLVHVETARLLARMGYPDAARNQTAVVPAASARMVCEIECGLMAAEQQIDRGQLSAATETAEEVEDCLGRAIQCGALVDPWNVLGFQANFSLFLALENSIRDHRVDELIDLVDRIFALEARLMSAAAAHGDAGLVERVRNQMRVLAQWWDRYATVQVEDVEHVQGEERCDAANRVSSALSEWQDASAAAGDVMFWRKHVVEFETFESYAAAVAVLLDHQDIVAAMALLMQWLSQANETGLGEGDDSFDALAIRWMHDALQKAASADSPDDRHEHWTRIRKFFDFAEANAESRWNVPEFELGRPIVDDDDEDDLSGEIDESDEFDSLFSAAYENVTYRDSALDGQFGDLLDEGAEDSDYEFEHEARVIASQITLQTTAARLWKLAARAFFTARRDETARPSPSEAESTEDWQTSLQEWQRQARQNRHQLLRLIRSVRAHPIPLPGSSAVSVMEYDRRRQTQHALLDRLIDCYLETSDAVRTISMVSNDSPNSSVQHSPVWESAAVGAMHALVAGNSKQVRTRLGRLRAELRQEPLLVIPLERGGDPVALAKARDLHRLLASAVQGASRRGMFDLTIEFLELAQTMESENQVGPGGVTMFDRLFDIGYRNAVECVVRNYESWETSSIGVEITAEASQSKLLTSLEFLSIPFHARWLDHARSMRLSVLETIDDDEHWEALVEFIQHFGHDLFAQAFFLPGNLRAVLDRGVEVYLDDLKEASPDGEEPLLVVQLERLRSSEDEADRREARLLFVRFRLVVEAVIEGFVEYNDYNHTTIQSDRGEALYTLLAFLRLKARYDRVAWQLVPPLIAHQVLARRSQQQVAEKWRYAVTAETHEVADSILDELDGLERELAMRLQSVSDRLRQRFVHPLKLDRLLALVAPAVEAARRDESEHSLEEFLILVEEFAEQIPGAGLEMPEWLEALEDEVGQAVHAAALVSSSSAGSNHDDLEGEVPWASLSRSELDRRLDSLPNTEAEE